VVARINDAQPSGIQSSVLDIRSFAPGHYFYLVALQYRSGRVERFDAQVMAVDK